MRSNQEKVEQFLEENEMNATTAFRLIDVMAEIGEIASDAAKSSEYGMNEENLEVKEDEIGDALFSLLSLASDLEIDADKALQKSLEKYGSRIDETGDAGSE